MVRFRVRARINEKFRGVIRVKVIFPASIHYRCKGEISTPPPPPPISDMFRIA